MSEENKNRNALTEHKNNYKLINQNLVVAYTAIVPSFLSKISVIIFNAILANKMYFKEGSKEYSEAEEKRTYNSAALSPEYILMQCNPAKYSISNKEIKKDVGNLIKKINQLDDLNIFYVWKFGFPHSYMFFIERDIGAWKCFNQKGVVTPKTILKIIRWHKQVTQCMEKMLKNENQSFSKNELENSFGLFINRMVGKMEENVNKKISLWKGNGDLFDYITILSGELRDLDPFAGMSCEENFLQKIPPSLSNKLKNNTKEKQMNAVAVENEIIPKDANIGIRRQKRTRRSIIVPENKLNAEILRFNTETDPFKNCNEFIYFYRDMISSQRKLAKFNTISYERKDATEILDLMIQNKRNNKTFLKGWILYFVNTHIPAHLPVNEGKTSLSEFRNTFNDFNRKYIDL